MKMISRGKFKTLLCTQALHTRFIWFPGALVAFPRSKPQKSVCFATSLPLSLPNAWKSCHHAWKSCHVTESGNILRSTCKMQGVHVTVKLHCCCSAGTGAPSQVQDIVKSLHFKADSTQRAKRQTDCQTKLILRHIQSFGQDFLRSWTSQSPERSENGQFAKFLPRSPGFPQQKIQLSASSLYLVIHLSEQQGGDREPWCFSGTAPSTWCQQFNVCSRPLENTTLKKKGRKGPIAFSESTPAVLLPTPPFFLFYYSGDVIIFGRAWMTAELKWLLGKTYRLCAEIFFGEVPMIHNPYD